MLASLLSSYVSLLSIQLYYLTLQLATLDYDSKSPPSPSDIPMLTVPTIQTLTLTEYRRQCQNEQHYAIRLNRLADLATNSVARRGVIFLYTVFVAFLEFPPEARSCDP